MEETKKPTIRFDGFTEDWAQEKLEKIISLYTAPVPTPHSGYMRLGIRSHGKGTFYNFVKAGQELETAQMHKVAANKFIVNITFAWEHAVAVTDESDAGKLVSHRFPQFSLSNNLDPKFFQFLILDGKFRHHLYLSSPGGAGRNRVLKIDEMLNYEAAFSTSIEEQQKIATTLMTISSIIKQHEQKYEKLLTFKKSMLEKMFPQNGAKVPEVRFAGFDGEWESHTLKEIVKEITRNAPTSDAPIMMITASNGFIEQSDRYSFDNAGDSLKKYILLKKGELAYNHGASKLRPYGSCFALTKRDEARIPFVYHCFSTEGNNPEFLSLELNGAEVESQLRKIVSSGARMDGLLNISFEEYTSVSILLPKEEEQNKIADFFRAIEELVSLYGAELEKLKNIKSALLEKMFV